MTLASRWKPHWESHWTGIAALAAGLGAAALLAALPASASDHADTPEIYDNPGTDLSDVFIFPSPEDAGNVVLVMNVRPLIPAGDGMNYWFDPGVLYQFKIDNNRDSIEDLVIQATFSGTGQNQRATLRGPTPPVMTGTDSKLVPANFVSGQINRTFAPRPGMKAFCGVREDPFFFDLERFYEIFPDRKTPLTKVPVADPNAPQALSWRPAGVANDFLYQFNVLSIVVELPRADLGGGVIGVWCTTSR